MARAYELISPAVSAEEWDAAYRRVRAYMAAMGVRHEFLLHRRAQEIMERCAPRVALADEDAEEAAANEVEREVLEWFHAVLGTDSTEQSESELAEISLRGRLAMLLTETPESWRGVFLSDPPWPDEFVSAVHSSYLNAVPSLRWGRMTSPPLDLGKLPQLADKALRAIDRARWLRLILLWGGFAALFGFVFWATR